MGDVGKSILHSIGIGGNPTPAAGTVPGATPLTAPQTVSSSDVLYGTNGFLPPPPGVATKATPTSFVDSLFQTQNNTPADANSDASAAPAFTPHKRTTLGLLADMLLSGLAHGRVTPFANKAYNENLTEALSGYAKDPQASIGMVNQFDPRLGMKLEAQYADDHRADDVAKRLQAAADEKYLSRVAGMYNAATPENFSQIDAFARKYAKVKGLDDSAFPTNIDEAKAFAAGDIDPYNQQRLQQTGQALTVKENLDIQRQNETERHNREMENKPSKYNPPKPKTIMRNGKPLGVMSPDGSTMRLYDEGSSTWVEYKLRQPGNPNSKVFNGFVDASGSLVDKTGKVIRKAKGAQ